MSVKRFQGSVRTSRQRTLQPRRQQELIPRDGTNAALTLAGKTVELTNLQKPFWPELNLTKGDLLRYYAEISSFLLPHVEHRAMVMKRYPNGAAGDFFFQKR